MRYELVVVGTSWGGLAALRLLVSGLSPDFRLPLIIVQHRHRDSAALLSGLLQEQTTLKVCEVEDKQPVESGTIYLAPADYHLLVERDLLSLSTEEPVRYSRPSIDVTFSSAADAYGAGTIGVVLTGANADGAVGLRRIVDRGGLAIVQDPATAESRAMPAAALTAVPSARVLAIPEIARFLAAVGVGRSGQIGTAR